jgi:hypothetical protein
VGSLRALQHVGGRAKRVGAFAPRRLDDVAESGGALSGLHAQRRFELRALDHPKEETLSRRAVMVVDNGEAMVRARGERGAQVLRTFDLLERHDATRHDGADLRHTQCTPSSVWHVLCYRQRAIGALSINARAVASGRCWALCAPCGCGRV